MAESRKLEYLDSINEYEREPVPESKTKRFKSFAGMVMGEHVAGTEFVIGPMFLVYGASATDVFLGLLIGNILAVLSWTFITAKTATRIRTTIFYQLEKISGGKVSTFYNVINGLMFTFPAAAMIAVSATAFGVPFGMELSSTDILPQSLNWVIFVLIVGSVITVVATFGYDLVSKFANIFAPWMPLVFLAGGIVMLKQLGVNSIDSFWEVANEKIWTGIPAEGKPKFTIWHVAAFAWLCNAQMHIGLGDTTIYRYARKWYYGFASALGTFIGHYMAWIASGIMCAAVFGDITPGNIAYAAMGIVGIFTVVIAGWTTANPTLYRAGLALSVIFPRYKRWKITLIIGITATLLACFPGVITELLNFLAFYALLVAPVGAIVWADVYLMKKIGLKDEYAAKTGISMNWAVILSWSLAFTGAILYFQFYGIKGMHFFLAFPAWIATIILYIIFIKFFQKKNKI